MSYRDKQYETVLLNIEDSVAVVQLNRPKAFNSINYQLLNDVYDVFSGLMYDPDVRAIVLTGNNKAFAAGADIKSVADYNAFEALDFLDKCHDVMFIIEDHNKPVIAAIEGLALGGGFELVLACDIRIAAENCTFGFPEVNIGIFPGAGGTQRTPRSCSIAIAKQLIYTGDNFNAALADKAGLVNMVVPAGETLEAAKKMARKLAKKSPLALRAAKQSVNMSMSMDIKAGCRFEQSKWSMLFASEDQKEGMGAFIEKRQPDFKGK